MLTAATPAGTLDKGVVRRVVKQHRATVFACFEREPDQIGMRIVVDFVIGPTGRVTSVKATHGSASVRACVSRAFANMKFPPPRGGSVAVSYPVQLCGAGS